MVLNTTVRDAILAASKRRAEADDSAPKYDLFAPGYARIAGRIDVEAPIRVVAGVLAGGL